MSPSQDEAERRIELRELELARIQTEETTPRQIEAALVREQLKVTLGTASVFARTAMIILDELGDSLEASVERMARDLRGR